MKHKIIMLLVNLKDGEIVEQKVINMIQVHLHGVKMELILQVNLMMIIIKLLMIGLWLKLVKIIKLLETIGLMAEEVLLLLKLKL